MKPLAFWRQPYSMLIGALIGAYVAFSSASMFGFVRDLWDDTFPVLSMSGKVLAVEGDAAQIHMVGTKHRGTECQLLKVYGYSVAADGTMYSAHATRIDIEETGIGLPAGRYDIGVWSIRPVQPGATSVRVYSEHNCVGRIVKTKIADVELPAL